MDRARMANTACAKETFCFEGKWLPFYAVCSNQALAQRPRRDGFAILETQKTWNPPRWLKSSVCSWFSLGGTSLSCGGMSESKLLERVLRGTWLWCFPIEWPPMEWKGRLSPVPVLWMASIPPVSCLPRILSFSSELREKPNTEVASRAGLWGSWWRAQSPVIDGPDLSIASEEQASGRVVYRVIVPNKQLKISVQLRNPSDYKLFPFSASCLLLSLLSDSFCISCPFIWIHTAAPCMEQTLLSCWKGT